MRPKPAGAAGAGQRRRLVRCRGMLASRPAAARARARSGRRRRGRSPGAPRARARARPGAGRRGAPIGGPATAGGLLWGRAGIAGLAVAGRMGWRGPRGAAQRRRDRGTSAKGARAGGPHPRGAMRQHPARDLAPPCAPMRARPPETLAVDANADLVLGGHRGGAHRERAAAAARGRQGRGAAAGQHVCGGSGCGWAAGRSSERTTAGVGRGGACEREKTPARGRGTGHAFPTPRGPARNESTPAARRTRLSALNIPIRPRPAMVAARRVRAGAAVAGSAAATRARLRGGCAARQTGARRPHPKSAAPPSPAGRREEDYSALRGRRARGLPRRAGGPASRAPRQGDGGGASWRAAGHRMMCGRRVAAGGAQRWGGEARGAWVSACARDRCWRAPRARARALRRGRPVGRRVRGGRGGRPSRAEAREGVCLRRGRGQDEYAQKGGRAGAFELVCRHANCMGFASARAHPSLPQPAAPCPPLSPSSPPTPTPNPAAAKKRLLRCAAAPACLNSP
jgi:hypothetical protein